jgi:hypothetical protein
VLAGSIAQLTLGVEGRSGAYAGSFAAAVSITFVGSPSIRGGSIFRALFVSRPVIIGSLGVVLFGSMLNELTSLFVQLQNGPLHRLPTSALRNRGVQTPAVVVGVAQLHVNDIHD